MTKTGDAFFGVRLTEEEIGEGLKQLEATQNQASPEPTAEKPETRRRPYPDLQITGCGPTD